MSVRDPIIDVPCERRKERVREGGKARILPNNLLVRTDFFFWNCRETNVIIIKWTQEPGLEIWGRGSEQWHGVHGDRMGMGMWMGFAFGFD